MKCPDALEEAVEEEIGGPSEQDELFEQEVAKAKELAAKWFKHNEVVCLEIDTVVETCIVKEIT